MEKTDKVRIETFTTNLTFSIKGMPAIPCCGEMNIPDGEVYTAPVKNSVNGVITYNTPSPYNGNIFNNIREASIIDVPIRQFIGDQYKNIEFPSYNPKEQLTFKSDNILDTIQDSRMSKLEEIFDN